jgi:hypothetical protein
MADEEEKTETKPKPKRAPKKKKAVLPTPRELYHLPAGSRLRMKGFTASVAKADAKGVPLEIDYRDPETGARKNAKFKLEDYLGVK